MASGSYTWVEIHEPQTHKVMYANVETGDLFLEPPPNTYVKKADSNQWWELVDENYGRTYYYNTTTQATVWTKPAIGDIISLAKIQTAQKQQLSKATSEPPAAPPRTTALRSGSGGSTPSSPAPVKQRFGSQEDFGGSAMSRLERDRKARSQSFATTMNTSDQAINSTAMRGRTMTNPESLAKKEETQQGQKLEKADLMAYAREHLNLHTKGFIVKKKVSLQSMLTWSKEKIKKPMVMTLDAKHRKAACEIFKLIQVYMGDKPLKTRTRDQVIVEIVGRGWATPELRDEIFVQLCRQTSCNPNDDSLTKGWDLMTACVALFPPSTKFQSYLEGYLYRNSSAESGAVPVPVYAKHCLKRLNRVVQTGAKKGNKAPTLQEINHEKNAPFNPSVFGATLEEIMLAQAERFPDYQLPWVLSNLAETILRLKGHRTEGIFRVPGDIDGVNALKVLVDKYELDPKLDDPHVPGSLLKLWFRELYEPLIPPPFYDECVNSDNFTKVKAVVQRLPEINRLVLEYTVHFLQTVGMPENVPITKMAHDNLAMVWGPNFLRCPSVDPQHIFEASRKEQMFVKQLISNMDTSHMQGVH
eukprot:Colp12_sorted_trinity150504_noHs@1554